jgi:putative transposase
MKRGYKYRIYPTEEQKKYIDLCIKANVWFWNYALDKIDQHYNDTKDTDEKKKHLSAQYDVSHDLPMMKKNEKTSWIKYADSTSFIETCKNLDKSFSMFFKKKGEHPKKHKNEYNGSYTSKINLDEADNCYDFNKGIIILRKAGEVKTVFHRKFKGIPKSFTISKKSYDYYEVSILVDDTFVSPELSKPTLDGTVGIDLGIKKDSNVILSDGTKYETVQLDKIDRQIKRIQMKLSKKTWIETDEKVFSKKYNKEINKRVPSKNYLKLKDKLAKLQAKKERIRSYNNHQITSSIVKNDAYDTICMETLNVSGMMKNEHISKSVANANMSEISRQLEYKAGWHGKNFVKVDRFFASSQTCNCCGYKNENVKNLSVRSWTCPVCGAKHDRDINAAINIKNEGYRIITTE